VSTSSWESCPLATSEAAVIARSLQFRSANCDDQEKFQGANKFNRAQRKSQLAIQAITIGDLSARFQFHVASGNATRDRFSSHLFVFPNRRPATSRDLLQHCAMTSTRRYKFTASLLQQSVGNTPQVRFWPHLFVSRHPMRYANLLHRKAALIG
jgi:hypothetical protein